MNDVSERLARRFAALVEALTSLGPTASYAAAAALVASPGFRVGPDPADPVLAAARERCRRDLARVLPSGPPVGEPVALAGWLTGIRAELVHPMTGEQMCLLDWVLRGGEVSVVAGTT